MFAPSLARRSPTDFEEREADRNAERITQTSEPARPRLSDNWFNP